MDPNATPWRVLEDQPVAGSAAVDSAPARPRAVTIPRSAVLTGGLALILAIGAFALAFGSSASGSVDLDGGVPLASDVTGAASSDGSDDRTAAVVIVEIVGAVDRPGVYRLPPDSRVGDLVTAAGGYGPRVDTERAGRELNLAAALHDGDQVRVPSRDDTEPAKQPPGASGAPANGSSGPVDLNRATEAQLDALPGIGPVTVAKILGSRDEQPFGAVADLRTRKLVGEKTFEALKDLVTVR